MEKTDKTGIGFVVETLETPVLKLDVMSYLRWSRLVIKGNP